MREEEKAYLEIGQKLEGAQQSQMFGKPCFKVNGKAFMSLFDNQLVFKLTGDAHKEALSLDGTQLFDLSRRKCPVTGKMPEFYSGVLCYVNSNE